MPKSPLQKSLQEYISKIKKTPSSHFRIPSKFISQSTKRFIRGCKHPKTHSFALENTTQSESQHIIPNNYAATLDDVDRFLFDNFKSLYINDEDYDDESKCKPTYQPPRLINPPPNLRGSQHIFGSSSSQMEDNRRENAPRYDDMASSSSTTTSDTSSASMTPCASASRGSSTARNFLKHVMGPEDFITLLTYSPNPYNDFKQSMQEMVEARLDYHGKVNWDFMEELLSCYMNLNDKKSYKYILSAFVDLVVSLRENSIKAQARPRSSTSNLRI